jgi:hypothetical protein
VEAGGLIVGERDIAGIPLRLEMLFIERRGEARPAGAAFEFVPRQEQRHPAEPAREHTIAVLVE